MSKEFGVLAIVIAALAGCSSESPRVNAEGDLLAAGIPGAVAATVLAEQDSTPLVARRVWGGPDVDLFGGVSPDGRYLSFVDWESGNIAVRELATGETRLVTASATTGLTVRQNLGASCGSPICVVPSIGPSTEPMWRY